MADIARSLKHWRVCVVEVVCDLVDVEFRFETAAFSGIFQANDGLRKQISFDIFEAELIVGALFKLYLISCAVNALESDEIKELMIEVNWSGFLRKFRFITTAT